MRRIGIVADPLFRRHDNGPGHPESPERLDAVERGIARFAENAAYTLLGRRPATTEELAKVHSLDYIATVERTAARNITVLDGDTRANRFSYEVAVNAVGGAIDAVDSLLAGNVQAAFCAIRPPGHHAEFDRAMGFCIFNTAAVVALHALAKHRLTRIVIFDWDVHHGNGTMHCFYDDDRVLYVSLHQSPHYPGTGAIDEVGRGAGAGYTVNVPLPPGCGDADYLASVDEIVAPLLAGWAPELLIISAGYDAHHLDPLASMNLSSAAYGAVTSRTTGAVPASTPVLVVLEGGYDLTALEEGTLQTLTALSGSFNEYETSGRPGRSCRFVIESVRTALAPYHHDFDRSSAR